MRRLATIAACLLTALACGAQTCDRISAAPAYNTYDTREIMPAAMWTSCVLWAHGNYNPAWAATWAIPDYSPARNNGGQTISTNRPAYISGSTNGNGCLLFGGGVQSVSCGNIAAQSTMSLALWFRGSQVNAPLISKQNATLNIRSWVLGFDFETNIAFWAFEGSTTNYTKHYLGHPTTNYVNSAWHHIVLSKDGTNTPVSLLDGVQRTTTNDYKGTGAGAISNTAIEVVIGNVANIGAAYIGSLDDVMLFNRALSVAEMSALYARSKGMHP